MLNPYQLFETKMQVVETEWWRLGDIGRGFETASWGLQKYGIRIIDFVAKTQFFLSIFLD